MSQTWHGQNHEVRLRSRLTFAVKCRLVLEVQSCRDQAKCMEECAATNCWTDHIAFEFLSWIADSICNVTVQMGCCTTIQLTVRKLLHRNLLTTES